MADPIIYGPAYSTYVRTARLAHEEKGVAYRLVEVDMLKGETSAPEHLARHPFGRIPAYEHDGFALYETGAITRYVDEAFPGPKLQPIDLRQRARMNQVMSVIDSYAYGPMVQKVVIQRLVVPLMGGKTDTAIVLEAMPAVEKACAALAKLIGDNAFFAGPSLSLADLHAIPVFGYFSATPEAAGVFNAHPALKRWWDKVGAMASVQKTTPKLG
jgi:glutathione S-transferase